MACGKCYYYSRSLGRCKQGKAHPQSIKQGVNAALIMGLSYICNKDGLRDKVAERIAKDTASGKLK